MNVRRTVLLSGVLALAGCTSQTYDDPIKITSHFNPEGAYGTYRTWDFAKYKNTPQEGALSEASFRLELANVIESALKRYELVRVFEDPDLEVGYFLSAEYMTEDELQDWFDSGEWEMPAYHGDRQDAWRKGSLILMVFEAESGSLLWRASAEAIVDRSTPEEQRKRLVERAVTMMLEELPKEKQE